MKMLLLDIECSPNLVFTWGLFNQFVGLNQIVEPGRTLCWSAKWLGEDKIMYDSVHKSSFKKMIKGVYDLMQEADVIIHYNGSHYDMPVLNKEFIECGLNPPKPVDEIDLYKVVKKKFRFPSNKLAYVVKELDLGEKFDEGFDLWVQCMNDDPKAWIRMERYNKNDILILEALYNKVKGWIHNHPNHGLYHPSVDPVCPNCGGGNLLARDVRRTRTRIYKRYHCKDCGAWPTERLSEKLDIKGVLK